MSWLQVFDVYVGIFTAQYPREAPGFMKYGATMQDLAARGHNWRFYDENHTLGIVANVPEKCQKTHCGNRCREGP